MSAPAPSEDVARTEGKRPVMLIGLILFSVLLAAGAQLTLKHGMNQVKDSFGVVNLNAAPWAEVWIDGRRVGETPIGNLSVSIGPHEVVFKHPQLGEKRQAISVTLGAPLRVSVDMK